MAMLIPTFRFVLDEELAGRILIGGRFGRRVPADDEVVVAGDDVRYCRLIRSCEQLSTRTSANGLTRLVMVGASSILTESLQLTTVMTHCYKLQKKIKL